MQGKTEGSLRWINIGVAWVAQVGLEMSQMIGLTREGGRVGMDWWHTMMVCLGDKNCGVSESKGEVKLLGKIPTQMWCRTR